MTTGRFKPGESGNPKGRPPKGQALTDILNILGDRSVNFIPGTRRVEKKIILAGMIWDGLLLGNVVFPDGRKVELSAGDWIDFVKWLYTRLDGAPKASMDIDIPSAAGQPVFFTVIPPGTDNESGEEQ